MNKLLVYSVEVENVYTWLCVQLSLHIPVQNSPTTFQLLKQSHTEETQEAFGAVVDTTLATLRKALERK